MTSAQFGDRNVSRETLDRLEIYAALLEKWNKSINLVAPSTIPDLWTRHFADSAQVFDLAPGSGRWIDLGTGGGFPGLICAILAAEHAPDLSFAFVESDRRKCEFLRTVIRETGVQADVSASRIEQAKIEPGDIISARALASLDKLLTLSLPLMKANSVCLFPKGANYQGEVDAALESWSFSLQKTPSITDPNAVILSLGDIARA